MRVQIPASITCDAPHLRVLITRHPESAGQECGARTPGVLELYQDERGALQVMSVALQHDGDAKWRVQEFGGKFFAVCPEHHSLLDQFEARQFATAESIREAVRRVAT